jgi:hypothetical protein
VITGNRQIPVIMQFLPLSPNPYIQIQISSSTIEDLIWIWHHHSNLLDMERILEFLMRLVVKILEIL